MKTVNHILLACMVIIPSSYIVSAADPEEFILKFALYPGGPTAIETIVLPQRPFDICKVLNGERISTIGAIT